MKKRELASSTFSDAIRTALASAPRALRHRRARHPIAPANPPLCHIEAVSATLKRKSEIVPQRLASQGRRSEAQFSEIAAQRLGRPSLTRANVEAWL